MAYSQGLEVGWRDIIRDVFYWLTQNDLGAELIMVFLQLKKRSTLGAEASNTCSLTNRLNAFFYLDWIFLIHQ